MPLWLSDGKFREDAQPSLRAGKGSRGVADEDTGLEEGRGWSKSPTQFTAREPGRGAPPLRRSHRGTFPGDS